VSFFSGCIALFFARHCAAAFAIHLPGKTICHEPIMKKHIHLHLLAVVVLFFTLLSARAQRGMGAGMGGAPPTPEFGGYMAKIFGDNANFSANIEMHSAGSDGVELVIPGKIATLDGKSRFWVDMTEMKGMKLPPQALAQMRMMGMDKMIMISRPDKNLSWMIYPGLQAYVETPGRDPESAKPASDFKIETTDLGKEDVDGHPCAKNKFVVTDKDGKAH
jgi:hypothetical protein